MVMAQPNRNPNNSNNNSNTTGASHSTTTTNPSNNNLSRKSNLKFVLRNNDGGTKKETFVVNTPLKKVTIVGPIYNDDEELVASSPGQRNWRGIFIALLVIAAVLGLIVFSIFLLSPEDEGNRIRGQRLTLADVTGDTLRPKPMNSSWISDVEVVYRDTSGGLSILNLDNFTISTLMTNSTFRQLNAVKFSVSPDVNYVLLLSDVSESGARYNVFEVQTRNQFPLSHKDGVQIAPQLQHVVWAPNPQAVAERRLARSQRGSSAEERSSSSPPGQQKLKHSKRSGEKTTTTTTTVTPLPSDGAIKQQQQNSSNASSTVDNKVISFSQKGQKYSSLSVASNSQGIAFVHDNDVYFKPKVQSDLFCRITTTGKPDVIYNGIPNWFYANVAELKGETLSFSPDGQYLSFLSFNDSEVNEYKYTIMGDENNLHKYPEVRSLRYPKANTPNPNVTVFVVNLSVLKFIFPHQIRLPEGLVRAEGGRNNSTYVGGMVWASSTELSVTITNRDQTNATTVLCSAPLFHCRPIYTEEMLENTTVLPSDRPFYSSVKAVRTNSSSSEDVRPRFEGYLLKRLPVRDGEFGHFRHIVFISVANSRTVPITMGRFEVTEILGWNDVNEKVYFMATVEDKPGQRHLFEVVLKLNFTDRSNRVYVTTTNSPNCLTCDNSPATYRLLNQNFTNNKLNRKHQNQTDTILVKANQQQDYPSHVDLINNAAGGAGAGGGGGGSSGSVSGGGGGAAVTNVGSGTTKTNKVFLKQHENYNPPNKLTFIDSLMKLKLNPDDEDDGKNLIRNNCLFNKVTFSPDYSYYIQQCLGPERPATFIVETKTNKKIFVLDSNDQLTDLLAEFAMPQIRKMSVELKDGFLAQVRLFLPPGLNDDDEVAFPLIVQMNTAPGEQLVSEEFLIDWNWYLASSQQMIVAQIDARGSGFQGELLKSKIIGRLGGPEIEDQLAILTYIRDTFSYVDRRKICAYGWGYGGYAATMALLLDTNQVLQCAVAINPISSFSLYNSFFAERYMPHSDDYFRALQESDLTTKASNLDNRNYLLVHGTSDVQVHPQHSLIFARDLINRDVVFRHQVYTDEGHSLKGVLTHLYKTMGDYFEDVFGPAEREEWDPTAFFAFKQ